MICFLRTGGLKGISITPMLRLAFKVPMCIYYKKKTSVFILEFETVGAWCIVDIHSNLVLDVGWNALHIPHVAEINTCEIK